MARGRTVARSWLFLSLVACSNPSAAENGRDAAPNPDGSADSSPSSAGAGGAGGASNSTGGVRNSKGAGEAASQSALCGDQSVSSSRRLPDGRTLLSLNDGSHILIDQHCRTAPGPNIQAPSFLVPTTIFGCCLPSGQCGLVTGASSEAQAGANAALGPLACVPYSDLAATGWGSCTATPARPPCDAYDYVGCYTVPRDPTATCSSAIDFDAGNKDAEASLDSGARDE